MKKVCFVIASLHNSAGMERMSTELANSLCRQGIQVDFILHSTDVRSFFKLDPSINIYTLKRDGDIYKNVVPVAFQLRRMVIENNYDVLINVGVRLAVLSFAVYLCSKCKVISWEHFAMNKAGIMRQLKHYLGVVFSNHTVLLTNADLKHYPIILRRKLLVIQNFTTINSANRKADLNSHIVLAAGRLDDKVKGFDYLLKAWKKIAIEKPSWHLRICGGGDPNYLQQRINDYNLTASVTIVGRVSDMGEEYFKASVFVCSSIYEPFGLVLIEAKSYGVPVVSFNCPFGPGEIVQESIDGFLAENKNIDELKDALLKLMNNREDILRMGKAAQLDYYERWSLDAIKDKWLKLILD